MRGRPVPRNTHARLFARSIDGLINVSAVGTASARIAVTASINRAPRRFRSRRVRHRRRRPRRRTRRRRYRDVTRPLTPSAAFPLLSLSRSLSVCCLSLFFSLSLSLSLSLFLLLLLRRAFLKSHSPCTQAGVYALGTSAIHTRANFRALAPRTCRV